MSDRKMEIVKARKAGARPKTVGVKYITEDNGDKTRIYTVSSNSPDLAGDLLYVFQKSIEKERRENKRLLGNYDGKLKKIQQTNDLT